MRSFASLLAKCLSRQTDLPEFLATLGKDYGDKAKTTKKSEDTTADLKGIRLLVLHLMQQVDLETVQDREGFDEAYEAVRGRAPSLVWPKKLVEDEDDDLSCLDGLEREEERYAAYKDSAESYLKMTEPTFRDLFNGDPIRPYMAVVDSPAYNKKVLIMASLHGETEEGGTVHLACKIGFDGEPEVQQKHITNYVYEASVNDDFVKIVEYREGAYGKCWGRVTSEPSDRLNFFFILRDGEIVPVTEQEKEEHRLQRANAKALDRRVVDEEGVKPQQSKRRVFQLRKPFDQTQKPWKPFDRGPQPQA